MELRQNWCKFADIYQYKYRCLLKSTQPALRGQNSRTLARMVGKKRTDPVKNMSLNNCMTFFPLVALRYVCSSQQA